MIDLHTHSIFSDGELIPAELARRAAAMGYEAIAITDHMDQSNIDFIIPRIIKAVEALKNHMSIKIMPGAEITHVPPALIPDLVKEARRLGAKIIVIHGESVIEPVAKGTNRAAIEAGADILAHPGLITQEDLIFAKERGIALEITARKGHSLSNGYVAKQAINLGIPLVINTDAHSPSDLITKDFARQILLSTGIEEYKIDSIFQHSKNLIEKALRG
ncbi:MAG: histidinol phosphate phosphatase domain-containing protein [Thermodesulfovibrionales bacterium]|nr:histidinol phosphate phosphatase domain-containing protein [Thermodesulfovibrionales bacterium]